MSYFRCVSQSPSRLTPYSESPIFVPLRGGLEKRGIIREVHKRGNRTSVKDHSLTYIVTVYHKTDS